MMPVAGQIIRIRQPLVRVPVWSLWCPLVLVPGFVLSALLNGAFGRLLQAECWSNVWAFYLIGLDGWEAYE